MKILLADDERGIRLTLSEDLEEAGHEVVAQVGSADELFATLADETPDAGGEAIQAVVYEVGKAHGFEPLRDWFSALYEVLLGQSQGPRFGSFVALYGLGETVALL